MLTSRNINRGTLSACKPPTLKRQLGLGSVELVLIAIVLLLMMHITWATALSMVHYHQRVVEARNSAYKTELYLGGEPSKLDKIIQKADEDVIQPLEATLAKFDPVLEYVDLDEQISSAMNSMLKYLGSPVNSYSKHETDNDQLYTDMIELTWDNMNEYKVDKGDNELMIDRVKPLISIIRDKNSSFSTGIGFSQYYPFAGIFTTGAKPLLMRSYHYADFADFVDILGNDDLRSGYNEEMEKLLPPIHDRKLFNTIFPNDNEEPVLTPVDLPFPFPDIGGGGTNPGIIAGEVDEETVTRAKLWADAVKSNEKWTWADLDPDSTDTEREKARDYAKAQGWVPHIPIDPVTKFADFSSVAIEDIELPKDLWEGTREQHFAWLNNEIGGKVEGYTWHHHEDEGRMQLVPFGIHRSTSHKGGCTTWAPKC